MSRARRLPGTSHCAARGYDRALPDSCPKRIIRRRVKESGGMLIARLMIGMGPVYDKSEMRSRTRQSKSAGASEAQRAACEINWASAIGVSDIARGRRVGIAPAK